jgi:NADPH2:quinone reductase
MRALELRSYAGPKGLALADLPEPAPDAQQVLLEVQAIGINFPDLLMTRGLYQVKPDLPFVPGCEIAGVVRSAPEGSGWKPGDAACAFVWTGGFAELANVPLNAIVRAPDGADAATAAAMVVNYHTVHFGLVRRGRVQKDETLLVLGAGGGIGSAALQVGRGLGARAIAGVANEEQAETARAAGADDVLVLEQGYAKQIKAMTDGRGVDAVLDPLGDWLFDEALRALAPEGRTFLDLDPELMVTQGRSLNEMYREGFLRPHIGARYTFEQIPEAMQRLSEGKVPGKAIAEFTAS